MGTQGQQCNTLCARSRSLPRLCSLRDLLAFQIPSWEMETKTAFIKATAGSSSKGAGHGARRRPLPQPPSLCPQVPPFLLLFTETETNVSTVTVCTLCHSLLGVWLEHLGRQFQRAQARQPGPAELPQAGCPAAAAQPRSPRGPGAQWPGVPLRRAPVHASTEWNRAMYSIN